MGLEPDNYQDAVISPDGTRIALARVDRSDADVWVWSLQERNLRRLTFEPGVQRTPLWTPDGARIVYESVGQGLFWRAADGTGQPEQLLESADISPFSWSADGRLIAHESAGDNNDIVALAVQGNRERETVIGTTANERRPAVSPDGQWLAYEMAQGNERSQVYVRPFPDVASGPWQVSLEGGQDPDWSSDGGALFFLSPVGVISVDVGDGPTFSWGQAQTAVERAPYAIFANSHRFDVASDGRLLMWKTATPLGTRAESTEIVLVQNWFSELERLLPTD